MPHYLNYYLIAVLLTGITGLGGSDSKFSSDTLNTLFPAQPLTHAIIKKEGIATSACKPLSVTLSTTALQRLWQAPITTLQKTAQIKTFTWLQSNQNAQGKSSDWQKAGSAFLAGASGALIETPFSSIQLYSQNTACPSRSIFSELGFKGSFRGLVPNAVLKEGPFAIGYQFLAPKLKSLMLPYFNTDSSKINDSIATAVGGAAAGLITAIATQPGTVMCSKMQSDLEKNIYKSSWQTAKKIYLDEGVSGFFRGLLQRSSRAAIAVPLCVAYASTLEKFTKN